MSKQAKKSKVEIAFDKVGRFKASRDNLELIQAEFQNDYNILVPIVVEFKTHIFKVCQTKRDIQGFLTLFNKFIVESSISDSLKIDLDKENPDITNKMFSIFELFDNKNESKNESKNECDI